MAKMRQSRAENPKDEVANRCLNLLEGQPFIEVKAMTCMKDMRLSMNLAVNFAIEINREIIAFDIVEFSKKSFFTLQIDEKIMQFLINGKMYALIEDLVNAHAMLYIELDKVDSGEGALGILKKGVSDNPIGRSIARNAERSRSQLEKEDTPEDGGDYFEGGSKKSETPKKELSRSRTLKKKIKDSKD